MFVILIARIFNINRRTGLNLELFFWALYLIVSYSGFLFVYFMTEMGISYKIDSLSLRNAFLRTEIFTAILFLSAYASRRLSIINLASNYGLNRLNISGTKLLNTAFVIGLLGLAFYVNKSGIVFLQDGGYENKNLANLGLGIPRLLLTNGLIFGFCIYLLKENKTILKIVTATVVGTILFLVMGGGRTISLILIIMYSLSRVFMKRIYFKQLIVAIIVSLVGLVFMTTLRYKYVFNNNVLELLMYQLQGSLSPVDSLAIILDETTWDWHNLSLGFNPLLTYVPRLFWRDKPVEILIPSVYFTRDILNYPSFVTISTGIVGESYLIFGPLWWLMPILLGLIFNVIRNSGSVAESYYNKLLFILFTPMFFGLFRDGLAVFIRDFMFLIIVHRFLRLSLKIKIL